MILDHNIRCYLGTHNLDNMNRYELQKTRGNIHRILDDIEYDHLVIKERDRFMLIALCDLELINKFIKRKVKL